jgi:hypothetical protein
MAKPLKAALTAAFITFIVVATGGIFFPATLGGLATVSAFVTFGTTLIGGLIGKMSSKGINASGGNFGTKLATRAPIAPRQIVYGQCRVGGTIVHMETSGVDNHKLHIVIVIAGHEIEEVTQMRLNDINCTTGTSTISGSTVYTVTNTDFRNALNENKFDGDGALIRYTFQDGSQTAVDGYMNAQLSSMGASDKFLGMAYVYIEMIYDSEKLGGGIPATSFKVKGKNVYDPRTSAVASSDLQRSNPALIVRDFLTNTQYGLKAETSEINDTTNAGGFASAANTCDQNVTLADGSTTERRYTANGFTNFSANGGGVIESILSSMAGKMTYVNGQFNVFAGASQSPSLTITDDELMTAVTISTNTTTGNLFNSIKPIYVDAGLNYTSVDAEVYQDSTFLNADTPSGESTANYVKRMEVQLPFTVTDTMAQRLGRIALKSQRQTTTLSVLVSLKFMRCQPNDWVYLTNERLGYNQKIFQINTVNLDVQDGDTPIVAARLELTEIEAAVFNFATNDYTTGQSEGSNVSTGSFALTAPSNLGLTQQSNIDGTTSKVDIKVAWTNNSSDKVTLTEIAYKLSSDNTFTSDFTVGKGIDFALIPNVVVGKIYNVKVRHIDVNGVASAYTSVVNITIAVAGSAPSTPTNLAVSSSKGQMLVQWTNPNNSDLRAVKVYRRTANTNPTDDTHLVDTLSGEPNKITTTVFGDQDGLTAGTTYYFWVRAINHSGQHSGFSSSVNGNFSAAGVADGAITTLKLAAQAVTNAKIAVAAIQGAVIAAGAITEAKLGTDAVTNAKLADNAVQTAQIAADAVSTAKIADNAVTNALIATDAVNQDSIAANAVTATQIVAGTITASEIATNAITTAKISADAITTAKINASAITATEIATNAITANKITADAITSDKIAANAITAAKITAGAIVAGKLAADSIVANNIQADAVTADAIAANSVVAASIVSGSITSTQIAAGTINGDRINVGTLAVEKFANVSSTIIAHTGATVPLDVFGSVTQRGSTNFTTQTQSTGTYLSLSIGSVRNGAKYRAIWSGVYGDCTNGVLEYSIDNSTFQQAAGGLQGVTMAAGTFRTYVFVYNGTISGLASNATTVYWRVRWITKLRSTYQSLYVFIDNTQ